MSNDDHCAQLRKGVAAWNAWRKENPNIHPDLSGAIIGDWDLIQAKPPLSDADLGGANLSGDFSSLDNLSQ